MFTKRNFFNFCIFINLYNKTTHKSQTARCTCQGTPIDVDQCPNDPNKTKPGDCGCGNPETDSDNDGIADCIDNCDDTIDTDGDGIPDCQDDCDNSIDTDGDGIPDCADIEECDGLDNNGDGQIDEGLTDSDGDGVCDEIDNCPDADNPNQEDMDGDGIGDICDDCVIGANCDDGEVCTINDVIGADCNCAGTVTDTDGDGVCDALDQCPGADDNLDTDDDGIPDKCDPCNDLNLSADTDLDGTPDCQDQCPENPTLTERTACGCGRVEITDITIIRNDSLIEIAPIIIKESSLEAHQKVVLQAGKRIVLEPGFRYGAANNKRLKGFIEEAYEIIFEPITDAGEINAVETICYTDNPIYIENIRPAIVENGLTVQYQWQFSLDGETWEDDPNSTNTPTFSLIIQQEEVYYRRVAMVANCDMSLASESIKINRHPEILVDAGPDRIICNGECIDLSVLTQEGLTYKWSHVNPTNNTIKVCPTISTNYIVTATDENGCTTTDEVMVEVKDEIVVAISPVDPICQGECTSLSVEEKPNLTYLWENGATTASIDICPEASTVYTVNISNDQNCSIQKAITVTVEEAPEKLGPQDFTICQGESLQLEAGAGNSYQWTPDLWIDDITSQEATVSPNVSTYYIVEINRESLCSIKDTFYVEVNDKPLLNLEDKITCSGEEVVFYAPILATYSYEWRQDEELAIISTAAELRVRPSQNTNYTVLVTNSDGECFSEEGVTVYTEDIPIEGPDFICVGQTVSIGVGPLTDATYQWSTGETTAFIDIAPLTTTTYSVVINGPSECATRVAEKTIYVSTAIVTELPTTYSCGEITLEAPEGLRYEWSTGQTTRTITVNPSTAVVYSVFVEKEDCDEMFRLPVEPLPALSINLEGIHPSCEGGLIDGQIIIALAEITGDYTVEYSLDETGPYTTAQEFANLAAGIYTVFARYQGHPNCTTSETITLDAPEFCPCDLSIEAIVTNPACDSDEKIGQIFIEPNINNTLVEYKLAQNEFWMAGGNLFENLELGTYTIEARLTGDIECSTSITATITDDLDGDGTPDCEDECPYNASPDASLECSCGEVILEDGTRTDKVYLYDLNDFELIYSPLSDAGTISGDQSGCPGFLPTMIDGGAATTLGRSGAVSYQWQSSMDNANWADELDGTNATFMPNAVEETTHFRRQATLIGCQVWMSSNTVTIEVMDTTTIALPTPPADDVIALNLSGGSGPYTILVTGPVEKEISSGEGGYLEIGGLVAGEYLISVENGEGCVSSTTAFIQTTNTLELTCFPEETNDDCTPTLIGFDIVGGVAPYQLTYINPITGETSEPETINSSNGIISNLIPIVEQSYQIKIVDSEGMEGECIFELPKEFIYDVEYSVINYCSEESPGSIDLKVNKNIGIPGSFEIDWYKVLEDGQLDFYFKAPTCKYKLENLDPGNYHFKVSSQTAETCVAEGDVEIMDESFTIDGTITNSEIEGEGSIQLTINGNGAPYTILWSNGEDTELIAGLNSGVYSVTVTNNTGCQMTADFNVANGEPPTTNFSVACILNNPENLCDPASIQVQMTGGIPPYSLTYTNTTSGVTKTVEVDGNSHSIEHPIAEETYEIEVSYLLDGHTISATCEEGAVLVDIPTNSDEGQVFVRYFHPSCTEGGEKGTINLRVNKNILPTQDYSITWTSDGTINDVTTNCESDITNAAPGVYCFQVTPNIDGQPSTCIAEGCITILDPISLTIDAPANCLCTNETNGVYVSASGGRAPYTTSYTLDGADPIIINEGETLQLAAGNYEFRIEDAAGCVLTESLTIEACDEIIIAGEEVINSEIISLQLSEPTPAENYTYEWTNRFWDANRTTRDIDNLTAGETYILIVTNEAGCTAEESFTIQGTPVQISCETISADCGGENIKYTVTGGQEPYFVRYQIDGGEPLIANDGLIKNPMPGNYSISVVDNLGNTDDCDPSISINAPTEDIMVEVYNTCEGGSTGKIIVNVNANAAGPGPYTLTLTDANEANITVEILEGECSGQFEELGDGDYMLKVDNGDGCLVETNINIETDNSISLSVEKINTCANVSQGVITVIPITNSTKTHIYTFDWTGIPDGLEPTTGEDGSQTYSDLPIGIYNVTVTSAHSCLAMEEIIIEDEASFSVSHDVLYNSDIANVRLNITGSNRPFNIVSQEGMDWTTTGDIVVEGLASGIHNFTITDALGCSIIYELEIMPYSCNEVNIPFGMTLRHPLNCNNNSPSGFIQIRARKINGDISSFFKDYFWEDELGNIIPETSEGLISGLPEGTYCFVAIDENNCISKKCTTLVAQEFELHFREEATNECDGIENGSIEIEVNRQNGTNYTYNFNWFDEANQVAVPLDKINNQERISTLSNLSAGNYKVTITNNSTGCSDVKEYTVDLIPYFELEFVANNQPIIDISCSGQPTGKIERVLIQGGYPPYEVFWTDYDEEPTLIKGTGFGIPNYPLTIPLPNIASVSAGNHTVFITDACGQTIIKTFNVPDYGNEPVVITADIIPGKEGEGQLIAHVTGGAIGERFFIWTNDAGQIVSNDRIAQNLFTGKYMVTTYDENNCFENAEFFLFNYNCGVPFHVLKFNARYGNTGSGYINPESCYGTASIIIDELSGSSGPYTLTILQQLDESNTEETLYKEIRIIEEPISSNEPLEIDNLPRGLYLIRVDDACEEESRELEISLCDPCVYNYDFEDSKFVLYGGGLSIGIQCPCENDCGFIIGALKRDKLTLHWDSNLLSTDFNYDIIWPDGREAHLQFDSDMGGWNTFFSETNQYVFSDDDFDQTLNVQIRRNPSPELECIINIPITQTSSKKDIVVFQKGQTTAFHNFHVLSNGMTLSDYYVSNYSCEFCNPSTSTELYTDDSNLCSGPSNEPTVTFLEYFRFPSPDANPCNGGGRLVAMVIDENGNAMKDTVLIPAIGEIGAPDFYEHIENDYVGRVNPLHVCHSNGGACVIPTEVAFNIELERDILAQYCGNIETLPDCDNDGTPDVAELPDCECDSDPNCGGGVDPNPPPAPDPELDCGEVTINGCTETLDCDACIWQQDCLGELIQIDGNTPTHHFEGVTESGCFYCFEAEFCIIDIPGRSVSRKLISLENNLEMAFFDDNPTCNIAGENCLFQAYCRGETDPFHEVCSCNESRCTNLEGLANTLSNGQGLQDGSTTSSTIRYKPELDTALAMEIIEEYFLELEKKEEYFSIEKESFNFYPNPTQNELNIELNLAIPRNIELSIINVLGEEVLTKSFIEIGNKIKENLSLDNLDTGIYFVQFKDKTNLLSSKKLLVLK